MGLDMYLYKKTYINNLKAIEKEHQKINGELREENKQLKEVIEEIREYAKEHRYYAHTIDVDELLQILDKKKERC